MKRIEILAFSKCGTGDCTVSKYTCHKLNLAFARYIKEGRNLVCIKKNGKWYKPRKLTAWEYDTEDVVPVVQREDSFLAEDNDFLDREWRNEGALFDLDQYSFLHHRV